MKTKILNYNKDNIMLAVNYLNNNCVVVFPTDTVYGVGANAMSDIGVDEIYNIKHRINTKALPVLIGTNFEIESLVDSVSSDAKKLMSKFWPGALTIIFKIKQNNNISKYVTGGLDTIAIRIPDSKIALDLLNTFGLPIATTSANISGEKSAVSIEDAKNSMLNAVPIIIDGGTCDKQFESTIVDATSHSIKIIRHGSISDEDIFQCINND